MSTLSNTLREEVSEYYARVGRHINPDCVEQAAAELDRLTARVAELEEALTWYGEQSRLARLIHSEGDKGRQALADDGGRRARSILERKD